MWIFLSVCIVCLTFLLWSERYIVPVHKQKDIKLSDVKDEDQPVNFDEVIAEIYGRLEDNGT